MTKVSAILTVASAKRISLARKAVNQFLRQHYLPFELIIVNGTSSPVLTSDATASLALVPDNRWLFELTAPPGLNSAAMKNFGLQQATGEFVICLDDDDYFHPSRLLYQMAHRQPNRPCLLSQQLRVDLSLALQADSAEQVVPQLALLSQPQGIACTMLFPRLSPAGFPWLFSACLNTGEYDELLARMQQQACPPTVCVNSHNLFVSDANWPLLSVALYHGDNELTKEQFFSNTETKLSFDRAAPAGLNQYDIQCLKNILQFYNFSVA